MSSFSNPSNHPYPNHLQPNEPRPSGGTDFSLCSQLPPPFLYRHYEPHPPWRTHSCVPCRDSSRHLEPDPDPASRARQVAQTSVCVPNSPHHSSIAITSRSRRGARTLACRVETLLDTWNLTQRAAAVRWHRLQSVFPTPHHSSIATTSRSRRGARTLACRVETLLDTQNLTQRAARPKENAKNPKAPRSGSFILTSVFCLLSSGFCILPASCRDPPYCNEQFLDMAFPSISCNAAPLAAGNPVPNGCTPVTPRFVTASNVLAFNHLFTAKRSNKIRTGRTAANRTSATGFPNSSIA